MCIGQILHGLFILFLSSSVLTGFMILGNYPFLPCYLPFFFFFLLWCHISFHSSLTGFFDVLSLSLSFLIFILLFYTAIFIVSFSFLTLGLLCSNFINSLKCNFRFFICDISNFLIYAFVTINFPLRTAFAMPLGFGDLCFYFQMTLDILWFSFWFLWPIGCFEVCCFVSTYL